MPSVLWRCRLGGRKGMWPVKNMGGWWRWALLSPDGVAPSRMIGVSASVNLPLHHNVQKFSSGTGSPGWSRKTGRKTVVCVCVCSSGQCLLNVCCCVSVCAELVCAGDGGAQRRGEVVWSPHHCRAAPRSRRCCEAARQSTQHHDESSRSLGQRYSRVRYVAVLMPLLPSNVQLQHL